jgi:hypothetical protein
VGSALSCRQRVPEQPAPFLIHTYICVEATHPPGKWSPNLT